MRNSINKKKVNTFENFDRTITKWIFNDFAEYSEEEVNGYTGTTLNCCYDILYEGTDKIWGRTEKSLIEVKQNTTNPKYPVKAIIKKDKLNNIFEIAKKNNSHIYFVSLLDGKRAYIFNMRELDWKKVQLINMRQKKTQVDDDSEMVYEWTYLIPYDQAIWSCDYTKYIKKYALFNKAKEEKELSQAQCA